MPKPTTEELLQSIVEGDEHEWRIALVDLALLEGHFWLDDHNLYCIHLETTGVQ